MKTLIIIMFLALNIYADNETTVKSNIKEVNVYLTGAQITRKSNVNIKKGTNIYVLKELSPNLLPTTIQVSGKGAFTIIGVDYRDNYLNELPVTPKIKRMQDSIRTYQTWIENKNQMLDVYTSEKKLILLNNNIKGNNNNLNPDDLVKLADVYRTRLKDLNFKMLEIKRKNIKYNKRIFVLNQQLTEKRNNYKRNSKEILVTISAKEATTGKLDVSYQVNNAGWIPSYDIRSTNKENGIEITYKGKVYQNTGNDWKNVKITLSTGNLNQSNQKPIISPWYIQYYNQYKQRNKRAKYAAAKPAMKSEFAEVAIEDEQEEAAHLWEFTETVTGMVNTEFKLSLKLTLKSGDKGKLMEVTRHSLPATYRYFAVPKLDKNAFLLARITGWEDLSLLPGEMSLYNNGTYVGKSFLDPNLTVDTLELSLGRDQFITFKRKNIKDNNKNIIIASNRKVTKAYEITIKNNKNTDIELVMMDQIPLSNISEIEVKLLENSGAEYDETTGFITWKMNMKAKETVKQDFKFSVKYPKNKNITNL